MPKSVDKGLHKTSLVTDSMSNSQELTDDAPKSSFVSVLKIESEDAEVDGSTFPVSDTTLGGTLSGAVHKKNPKSSAQVLADKKLVTKENSVMGSSGLVSKNKSNFNSVQTEEMQRESSFDGSSIFDKYRNIMCDSPYDSKSERAALSSANFQLNSHPVKDSNADNNLKVNVDDDDDFFLDLMALAENTTVVIPEIATKTPVDSTTSKSFSSSDEHFYRSNSIRNGINSIRKKAKHFRAYNAENNVPSQTQSPRASANSKNLFLDKIWSFLELSRNTIASTSTSIKNFHTQQKDKISSNERVSEIMTRANTLRKDTTEFFSKRVTSFGGQTEEKIDNFMNSGKSFPPQTGQAISQISVNDLPKENEPVGIDYQDFQKMIGVDQGKANSYTDTFNINNIYLPKLASERKASYGSLITFDTSSPAGFKNQAPTNSPITNTKIGVNYIPTPVPKNGKRRAPSTKKRTASKSPKVRRKKKNAVPKSMGIPPGKKISKLSKSSQKVLRFKLPSNESPLSDQIELVKLPRPKPKQKKKIAKRKAAQKRGHKHSVHDERQEKKIKMMRKQKMESRTFKRLKKHSIFLF